MQEPLQGFPKRTPGNGPRKSLDEAWTLDGDKLYCDIPQLLRVAGIENTQENRELATKIAAVLAPTFVPDAKIIIT